MLSRISRVCVQTSSRRGVAFSSSSSSRFFSSGSGNVLTIAEHSNGQLDASFLAAVTASSQLGNVTALVAGKDCKSVADQVSKVSGVSKVLVAEGEEFEYGIAENVTELVLKLHESNSFSHIVAAANTSGKNVVPRIAINLDVNAITDVTAVESESRFKRPIYAGNAIATIESSDSVKVMTVRPTAFDKAGEGEPASVESVDVSGCDAGLSKFVGAEVSKSDRPDLSSANVVISGGRGLKNGENFKLLEELADLFGGAVGASRAAVDAGFVPNDMQVGQTGKVVAPSLYVAVGISGAIQHLAGMKDSKTIVAINKDPEAPIFQVADYGLVADLFKAVPELTEKIKSA